MAEAIKKTTLPSRFHVGAHGVGRRKKSVARVWLAHGTGKFMVNGSDVNAYFDTDITRSLAALPLQVCPVGRNFNIMVNVNGGGKSGQADAIKLGIARALVAVDASLKSQLKKYRLLTVDDRIKERKKYGQRGARRKFQFVKR